MRAKEPRGSGDQNTHMISSLINDRTSSVRGLDGMSRPALLSRRCSFPIDVRNKSIAGHLVCLPVAAVYQPEVTLVDDRDEVAGLPVNGIGCPGGSLGFESRRVVCRENGPAVRAIPIHDDETIPAGLAL